MEQICHHPPISYIIITGPNDIYRFAGYSNYAIKAYINSIMLEVSGIKRISFKDGSCITYNNQQDTFGSTLIGTCHHQLHGEIKFEDEKNGITGYLNIGGVKKRPRDYFEGYIEKNGVKVCKEIFGNYMGYADFENERLFDLR